MEKGDGGFEGGREVLVVFGPKKLDDGWVEAEEHGYPGECIGGCAVATEEESFETSEYG